MAHGRGSTTRGQRDAFDPSLAELLAPPEMPTFRELVSPFSPSEFSSWTEVEDRRRFDPERALRSALSFSGAQANVGETVGSRRSGSQASRNPRYPTFDDGRHALVCARRQQRREVLFAKKRRGRGGGRRRRNYWSNVRC